MSNENVRHVKVLPYLSVVQSVEGSYDISLGGGETFSTGDGGFFIAPSNVQQTIVHHVNKKSGRMTARWVFIDVEVNKFVPLDLLCRFPAVINDDRKNELNRLFDRLFETDNIWKNYSDCYALAECLIKTATPIENRAPEGVQSAVAYVTEHYMEKITIEDLANVSNMSESNFYAAFRKCMGISPIAYLNNYRLSVAAGKLAESTDQISAIGYSVGISDPLYFSKLFKKTYGVAPKEYRRVYHQ